MPSLGTLMRQAMENRGLNGKELAEAIRKHPTYVSKLLRDEQKETPSPRDLREIGRVLGLSMATMLEAWGYPLSEAPPSPPEPESAHARVLGPLSDVTDEDAEVLKETALALIKRERLRHTLYSTPAPSRNGPTSARSLAPV